MFKRFMYDLYLDPGATWSAKNNKKMKTEKKNHDFWHDRHPELFNSGNFPVTDVEVWPGLK